MFDRETIMVGFHSLIRDHESVDALVRLIQEGLAPMGFNTLVLEARVQFRCFPEYSTGTVTYEDVQRVAAVCRQQGIRIVPLMPCLGHQNMGPKSTPFPVFQAHPELLERPDVPYDLEWPDFGGHSWCASNDGIYQYVLPMIDEIAEAAGAEAFHVGLDEVFDIGLCPKCREHSPANLFARTVKKLHDHLSAKGLQMMMWGDRLLDSQKMGYSMWEGDRFGTHPAIDMAQEVPRDIIVCDWHYEWHSAGYPSVETLMQKGFFTVPSFWRDAENAKHFWLHALEAKFLGDRYGWPGKLGGLLCTNWRWLDAIGVEGILAGMQGDVEKADVPGYGIGNVIAQVVPKGQYLRK